MQPTLLAVQGHRAPISGSRLQACARCQADIVACIQRDLPAKGALATVGCQCTGNVQGARISRQVQARGAQPRATRQGLVATAIAHRNLLRKSKLARSQDFVAQGCQTQWLSTVQGQHSATFRRPSRSTQAAAQQQGACRRPHFQATGITTFGAKFLPSGRDVDQRACAHFEIRTLTDRLEAASGQMSDRIARGLADPLAATCQTHPGLRLEHHIAGARLTRGLQAQLTCRQIHGRAQRQPLRDQLEAAANGAVFAWGLTACVTLGLDLGLTANLPLCIRQGGCLHDGR
jgi:hypothetical protein